MKLAEDGYSDGLTTGGREPDQITAEVEFMTLAANADATADSAAHPS